MPDLEPLTKNGEIQESCDMQIDIDDLSNQIIELTQQYGLQIESLKSGSSYQAPSITRKSTENYKANLPE